MARAERGVRGCRGHSGHHAPRTSGGTLRLRGASRRADQQNAGHQGKQESPGTFLTWEQEVAGKHELNISVSNRTFRNDSKIQDDSSAASCLSIRIAPERGIDSW